MKACQNVIVTLTIGDEQLDVELPAFLPVAEVNARVLEMLRTLYPQVYGRGAAGPPGGPGGAPTALRSACTTRERPLRSPERLRPAGSGTAQACRAALCWSNLLFLTNCSASFCILQRI